MATNNFTNSFIINALELPYFTDIYQFSDLTGLSMPLIFSLSKRSKNHYRVKNIKKRSGGNRIISAPCYSLKILQKWILVNILDKLKTSDNALAFKSGKKNGIVANASFHKKSLYTLSIDLSNFFTSIESKRVWLLFKSLGYNNFASTILTNLCTLDGVLPQGGVCSPSISNLICLKLDARLSGLCGKRGIVYSRYADDMCFSSDDKNLLKKSYKTIENIINSEGFSINDKKTKYMVPRNRKIITGIVISNEEKKSIPRLRAPKDKKKLVRAMIHKSIISGDYSNKKKILGLITYINYIERAKDDKHYIEKIKKYIVSCSDKIKIYDKLVDEYNNNLYFSDLPTLGYMKDFEKNDSYDVEYQNRQNYLQRYGINDICIINKDETEQDNDKVLDFSCYTEEDEDVPF